MKARPASGFTLGSSTRTLAVATMGLALSTPTLARPFEDPLSTREAVSASPSRAAAPACQKPQREEPLDLATTVAIALCNNPQTHAAWGGALARAAQVGLAKSAYLPTLVLTARFGASKTFERPRLPEPTEGWISAASANADLSYLLYDFGGRSANLRAAQELLFAANANQDNTAQSVFSAAVQAYYQVQAARAALTASEETERSVLESLRAAEARRTVGVGTLADVLQAQTAYSQASLGRIRSEGALNQALGVLANVLGWDANARLQLVPPTLPPVDATFERHVDELIRQARKRRPDLIAAEAQYRAADAQIDAARAAGRPSLSAEFNGTYLNPSNSGWSTVPTVGVSLTWPLFTGFATTYRIAAAKAEAEIKTAQRDQLNLQVALDVWRAYQGVVTATQAVRSSADLLASATHSEKVAFGRYKAGAGSILDLLAAEVALANARQTRIQSLTDWNIARAGLAQALGALDAGTIALLEPSRRTPSSDQEPSPHD